MQHITLAFSDCSSHFVVQSDEWLTYNFGQPVDLMGFKLQSESTGDMAYVVFLARFVTSV